MRLRISIAMLEIRNRKTPQSKVNICKSDVKIGDYVDSLCVCGLTTENTAHLLQCSLLIRSCTLDDLLEFNDTRRECAERWKKTV